MTLSAQFRQRKRAAQRLQPTDSEPVAKRRVGQTKAPSVAKGTADEFGALRARAETLGLTLVKSSGSTLTTAVAAEAVQLAEQNMLGMPTSDARERLADITHPNTRVLMLRVAKTGASPTTANASHGTGGAHSARSMSRRSQSSKEEPAQGKSAMLTSAASSGASSELAGFVSYRFVTQETLKLVYVFELQISQHWQRLGLGSQLLDVVEEIGRTAGRQGMLLTVHRDNASARRFYESKGLEVSPVSPSCCAPAALVANFVHELMQKLWDADGRSTMVARGQAARRLNEQRLKKATAAPAMVSAAA